MTSPWTAPAVERTEPPSVAGERESLEQWLDYQRATLLHKCAGLSSEQLKLRPVPPSTLSLLGLVRHMVDVERSWFSRRIGGRDLALEYSNEDNPDGDFDDLDAADAESDLAALRREIVSSSAVAATRRLDDVVPSRDHRQRSWDVRWIYVHMIEEYARHNGHADLIRELTDGQVGG